MGVRAGALRASVRSVPDLSPPLTGGCVCGHVRFEISAPLLEALYCHCKRCQRRTGTAFSLSARTAPRSLRITAGEGQVRAWRPPGGGWIKAFCAECGGHLYSSDPANPEVLSVRMGALDEDPGVRPVAHQFTAYAAPWDPIPEDGLPRFPERMPRESHP
jgi:hypothetical protein